MNETLPLDGAIQTLPIGIPADLMPLLGDPPVADPKDLDAYFALWGRFYNDLKPRDTVDIIATRDQVDLTWRILNLRKLQASLIRNARPEAARRLLDGRLDDDAIEDIAEDLMRCEWSQSELARPMLIELGITLNHLDAEALSLVLPKYTELDMMILRSDTMRHLGSRERDRRLDAYQKRLREHAAMIEADFEFNRLADDVIASRDEDDF